MEPISQVESKTGKDRNKIVYVVVGVLLIVLAATIFYFGYWKKTPEYSLGIIRDAVKNHDVAEFQRHVDLDTLLSRAFDDIVAASVTKESDKDIKNMATGFAQLLKQPIINVMKDSIKRYVETGTFDLDDKANQNNIDSKKDKSSNISAKEIEAKAGLSNSDFKGISYTKKDGKTAIVGVKLWDRQVAQEFIIDVKMRELEDGTWQIAEIANLSSYIMKLDEVKAKKLAELNQPIQNEINTAITIETVTAQKVAKDRWGFSNTLEVSIPATFNDSRSIIEVHGIVNVQNQGESVFKGTFSANGSSFQGKKATLKYHWDLNPFIPGQKTILNTPNNSLQISVEIRKIKFSDGSELHMLDELPRSQN